jgi:hypothetical protein
MKGSILNIQVSCFAHCKATTPAKVSLLSWLTSDKYRDRVEQIRSLQDEDLQKTIKTTLPAITPSGVFSRRDTEHLIEHSGFLAFDIDLQDNRHITNFENLKEQISHIASVAYCGLSVRGRGFWGLVPIPKSTPEIHRRRFDTLARDFREFNIILDPSGSDVCRLRIYSWDPDAYFNHNASIFQKITEPPRPQQRSFPRPAHGDTRDRVEAIISQVKERQIDMTQSYKGEWFGLAAALANEFGEGGRGYFHTLSQFHPEYHQEDTDKLFDSVLRKTYTDWSIGTLFTVAKNYGITLKAEAVPPMRVTSRPMESREVAEPERYDEAEPVKRIEEPEKILLDHWGVKELDVFFRSRELPEGPVRLDDCTVINDVRTFIEAEMAIVKGQNGNAKYLPYLDRLLALKTILN